MVGGALGVFAYASGNANFVQYLAIPAVPGAGELLIFCAALVGRGPRIPVVQHLSRAGVHGRHRRARARRDDPSTYMEVYEEVKDAAAFEALLEREGAKLGVQRKLERFVNAS